MVRKWLLFCLLATLFITTKGQQIPNSTVAEEKTIENLTVSEFYNRVDVQKKLVLVYFSADWCVVCKRQKPVLDEIKSLKRDSVEFLSIDMEKNPLIAEHFEIDALPAHLLYRKGKLAWDRVGFLSKAEILDLLHLYSHLD